MSAPAESPPSLDRRHFLLGSGVVGAGLILGLRLARQRDAGSATDAQRTFTPNAYVRIAPDDTITLVIGKAEMGQGINVGSAVILGEELDVDPQRIRVAFGGVDPAFYHPYLPAQFTGGSMSVQTTYEPLRKAGAAARAMLLAAAAKRWRVDVAQLRTADGRVYDGERSLSYGELAADAAREAVPAEVTLKARREFKYIGRPQRRIDTLEKITGAAQFGIDVRLPDMLTAVIARPPVFGATVRSFDASAARAVAGVVDVKAVPSGVAVVAQNTWAALRGRDALRIDWNLGSNAALDSAALRAQYRRLARQPGTVARSVGDADAAYRAAAPQRRLDVEYELPYLAHACMEPLNAVVHARAGGADLWVGTQNHSQDVDAVARVLGLRPEQVTLHSLFLGGGFGRRAASQSDFVTEAAQVARGYDRPVKVVWTREDDMRGGFYRPYNLTRVRAALDANGLPTCLRYVTVGQSVFAGSPFAAAVIGKDGLDPMSHEGVSNTPYAFAHLQVECHTTEPGVPVLWWRSVGHSISGFVVESVLDELAAHGRADPLQLRRRLLAHAPRHRAVLDRVAQAARWGTPAPAGRARGLALHESFGTVVAQVAEVSVAGGEVRVHKVYCAVDCGFAVVPSQVEAQMESGIVFGLSAALDGAITLREGRVQQGNFDTYPILRIDRSPEIEVHIVDSDAPLGGVGEPGTPPIAAAVCNAIYAATGRRIRRLPIAESLRSA